MHRDATTVRTDYVALAESLKALAYPVRLELLDVLRTPHTLGEIRVGAYRASDSGTLDRPVAKQTVAGHLQTMVESGLVRTEEVEGRGRTAYSVSPPRLYALIEELRTLSVLQTTTAADDLTGTVGAQPRPPPAQGPHLVLVHGVYEGKNYRLGQTPDRTDTIGRGPSCTVRLDYDPYVSTTNSRIEQTEEGPLLMDDPHSKNGTTLNWNRLEPGEHLALRSGDLIGVGRSRLLFLDR